MLSREIISTCYITIISIKSHRKLQIVSPKIASHQNGAFLACSDREVCITENCKCIIENCKRITENCKEVSPIIARKYHRKLQANPFIFLQRYIKTWETPGGVPTSLKAKANQLFDLVHSCCSVFNNWKIMVNQHSNIIYL